MQARPTFFNSPVLSLREQTGVTQAELARIGGTSQPTIAAYEAGSKSPSLDTINRLAAGLGLELEVLFMPRMTTEDWRSLAYHKAIMRKLQREPVALVARANKNLRFFAKKNPHASHLYILWKAWLELSFEHLKACCLDMNPLARDMRQVSPFAGCLSASERAAVIRGLRKKKVK